MVLVGSGTDRPIAPAFCDAGDAKRADFFVIGKNEGEWPVEIPFHGIAGNVHRQGDEPFHVTDPSAHVRLIGFGQREGGAVPVRFGGGDDVEVPREGQSRFMMVTAACIIVHTADVRDDVDLLPIGAG